MKLILLATVALVVFLVAVVADMSPLANDGKGLPIIILMVGINVVLAIGGAASHIATTIAKEAGSKS